MVETYVVVNAAIILLGFGPTRWTKDYALRYLVYAAATGMKWFILLLVVGLGEVLMRQWLNQYENNDTQVLLVVGAAVVLLALVWNLPSTIQSLLTGVSIGMGESLVTAARQTVNKTTMAGSALSKTAVGATGLGRSMFAAAQLANAQGRTGVGMISGTVANMASAAKNEFTDHAARGKFAGPSTGMGHRMSDNMRAKIAALQSNSIEKG
jgi:type IV secretion system protein TrbL